MENFTYSGVPEKDVDLLQMYFRSLVENGRIHEDKLMIDLRLIMIDLYPYDNLIEDDDLPYPSDLINFVEDKKQFVQDLECAINFLLEEDCIKNEIIQKMILDSRPYRRKYPLS